MATSRKSSSILDVFKRKSQRDSGSESTGAGASTTPEPVSERRREQIRRAQRLHRQRKAEHSHRLNAEIADLRTKDATKTAQIEHLDKVIQYLSSMLTQNGIPHNIPAVPDQVQAQVRVITTGSIQAIQVSMPHSTHENLQPQPMSPALDLNSTQLGVDFVLDLEHPCLYHHHVVPNDDFLLGHSGMMQASIMARAPTLIETGGKSEQALPSNSAWNVPAEELERLLMFSDQLRLPDEITPVQAWSQIRERGIGGWTPTKSVLDRLLQALKPMVTCYGFGAVLEKDAFQQILAQYTRKL